MTPAPFRFERLGEKHDRTAFYCGQEALDRYFQSQVTQDIRRRITNCFVVVEAVTGQVGAYYTLSAAGVVLTELPPEETKRLPRYPTLPAIRIGRLAVDEKFQRRGLGAAMLMDAVHRTPQNDAAAFTLLVDAKDDRAVAFYQHHGFRTLVSQPRTLFLPLATAQKALLQNNIKAKTKSSGNRAGRLPRHGSRFVDGNILYRPIKRVPGRTANG